MAVFNEILVGRYNRFLQKILGMKGGPPARSLAGEVMPVLPFYHGAESLIHQGWEIFGQAVTVAASVGNTSKVQLRNPAGSNVVAAVIKVAATSGANTKLLMGLSVPAAAAFATPATPAGFDSRGRRTSTCRVFSEAGAAIGGTIVYASEGLTATIKELVVGQHQSFPLLPDSSVQVGPNTVNTLVDVIFWWMERALEETELT